MIPLPGLGEKLYPEPEKFLSKIQTNLVWKNHHWIS